MEAPKVDEDIAISGSIKTCVYEPNGKDIER